MAGRKVRTGPVGRNRLAPMLVGACLTAIGVLVVAGVVVAGPNGSGGVVKASSGSPAFSEQVGHAIWLGLTMSTLNPNYWAFLALLALCQWIWPAQRDQRNVFSAATGVDLVWFVAGNALKVTVVAFILGDVTVAYSRFLGDWSLDLQPIFGFWGLAIVAFVITDAFAWFTHWCHHRVRTLWRLHAVHHSQPRLNVLSDNRTHVGEVIVASLIVFIPSMLLGLDKSAALALAFVGLYYSAILHSNVRTNFGPLRFVFMGPQAHRVHHAIAPSYYEHNFGTVFSWWDFLAGTYYRDVDDYPATGITDPGFPLGVPRSANPLRWVATFGGQFAYPFMRIAADLVQPLRALGPQVDRIEASAHRNGVHTQEPAVNAGYQAESPTSQPRRTHRLRRPHASPHAAAPLG